MLKQASSLERVFQNTFIWVCFETPVY